MGKLDIYTYLFVILWLYPCTESLAFLFPGEVTPNDPVIHVGDTLNLICNSTQYSSSQFIFQHTNRTLPSKYVTILSTTEAILSYPNLTFRDNGSYYCKVNSVNSQVTVGFQIVEVGTLPLKPEHVDCVVYNWREEVECTVKPYHQDQLLHTNMQTDTKVTLFNSRGSVGCELVRSNSTCVLPLNQSVWDSKNTVFNVKVIATNNLGSTPGDIVEMNLLDKVKPDSVKNPIFSEKTSNSMTLSWTPPVTGRDLIYNISYKEEWDSEDQWKEIILEKNASSYTLENLTPFTRVEVIVMVKPAQEGFWSDAIVVKGKTEAAVPHGNPKIAPGGYEILGIQNGYAQVAFFWQKIPQKMHFGASLQYQISYKCKGTKRKREQMPSTWLFESRKSSAQIQLPVGKQCLISLRAVNEIGPSPLRPVQWSVRVPSSESSVPAPPKFQVTILNQDMVNLVWTKSKGSAPSNHTLYWCPGTIVERKCKDELQWITFPSEINQHTLNVDSAGSFLYGISSDSKFKSSGVHFSDCFYQSSRKAKAPSWVRKSQKQEERSIALEWDAQNCNTNQGKATGYYIYYCETQSKECQGKEVTVKLEGEGLHYTIKDLHADKRYRIQVASDSEKGASKRSDVIYVKTTGLSIVKITFIGLGTVLIVVLFAVGMIGIICKCRRKHKHFTKGIGIKLPENHNNNILGSCSSDVPFIPQHSFDSGSYASRPSYTTQLSIGTYSCDSGRGGSYNEDLNSPRQLNNRHSHSEDSEGEDTVFLDDSKISGGYSKVSQNPQNGFPKIGSGKTGGLSPYVQVAEGESTPLNRADQNGYKHQSPGLSYASESEGYGTDQYFNPSESGTSSPSNYSRAAMATPNSNGYLTEMPPDDEAISVDYSKIAFKDENPNSKHLNLSSEMSGIKPMAMNPMNNGYLAHSQMDNGYMSHTDMMNSNGIQPSTKLSNGRTKYIPPQAPNLESVQEEKEGYCSG